MNKYMVCDYSNQKEKDNKLINNKSVGDFSHDDKLNLIKNKTSAFPSTRQDVFFLNKF